MPTKEQYWKNPEKYRALSLKYHYSPSGKLTYKKYTLQPKNRKRKIKLLKKWRKLNKNHVLEYNHQHRKYKADWANNYYSHHKKKMRARAIKYYYKDREKIIVRGRAYYHKNREKILSNIKSKKWKEKHNIYRANWRHENRAEVVYAHKRHFKISKNSITIQELRTIKTTFKICPYCRIRKSTTFEHIIPLFPEKGVMQGQHIKENLIRACISCNSSKNNKDPIEWCKDKGYPVPEIVTERLKIMKQMGVT